MRYYIADLHFFHAAMNQRMDKRGFNDVEEMNEYMIKKWNGKVRKNDDVVIIGDLSWGNADETNGLLKRLNGRLYLIQGNHEYMLYGHVHDTMDQRLLEQFQDMVRNTITIDAQGDSRNIPCNMINCFCQYSDYEPLTLDEWIECDKRRLEKIS